MSEKTIIIERISCIKISVLSEKEFEDPIETLFTDPDQIPDAEIFKNEGIDLNNFEGKILLRFNDDATLNLIKRDFAA